MQCDFCSPASMPVTIDLIQNYVASIGLHKVFEFFYRFVACNVGLLYISKTVWLAKRRIKNHCFSTVGKLLSILCIEKVLDLADWDTGLFIGLLHQITTPPGFLQDGLSGQILLLGFLLCLPVPKTQF